MHTALCENWVVEFISPKIKWKKVVKAFSKCLRRRSNLHSNCLREIWLPKMWNCVKISEKLFYMLKMNQNNNQQKSPETLEQKFRSWRIRKRKILHSTTKRQFSYDNHVLPNGRNILYSVIFLCLSILFSSYFPSSSFTANALQSKSIWFYDIRNEAI